MAKNNAINSLIDRDDVSSMFNCSYNNLYLDTFSDWLEDIKKNYESSYSKIRVCFDDDAYLVYGVLSKEQVEERQKAAELAEYERLKDEFEPDPESEPEQTDDEPKRPSGKRSFFSKLFGK